MVDVRALIDTSRVPDVRANIPSWHVGMPTYEIEVPATQFWQIFVAGAAVGMLAGWALGSLIGRRQITGLTDQVSNLNRLVTHDLPQSVSEQAAHRGNQFSGIRHAASQAAGFSDNPEPPDNERYLTHKIETEVFRNPDIPKGDINIEAVNGVVTVRGTVRDRRVMQKVLREVENVDGVREVVNYMKTPDELNSLPYTDPRR